MIRPGKQGWLGTNILASTYGTADITIKSPDGVIVGTITRGPDGTVLQEGEQLNLDSSEDESKGGLPGGAIAGIAVAAVVVAAGIAAGVFAYLKCKKGNVEGDAGAEAKPEADQEVTPGAEADEGAASGAEQQEVTP